MAKAILLSGGMDSIALAYWQRPAWAFTINYGQEPAAAEIKASKAVCGALDIEHAVLEVDCKSLGSGDLVQNQALSIAPSTEWWPYRNQLLVTLACMKGLSMGIDEVLVASVKSDGFHQDGTAEFYYLLNNLMQFQEGQVKVSAPVLHLTSEALVIQSAVPADILFYAHSCHKANVPCGHCRGCYKYTDTIKKLQDVYQWP